jgi:SAM-dependent methyltransferase
MISLDPNALAEQWRAWRAGIPYELAFWSRWLAQRGGEFALDFANRTNPALAADTYVEQVIERLGQPKVRLLDVGAGPLCCLGKISQHAEMEITAVDPMADFYDDLLSENQLVPLVRTQFGMGEDLALQFTSDSFDIVHIQNALDHSLDPVRVTLQMLLVCRLGGYVMLRHAYNEAEHERYTGFHKWNLTNDGEAFVVWTPELRTNLTQELAPFARSEFLLTDGYLINLFQKTAEVPLRFFAADGLRQHNFQRAVLRAMRVD